MAYSKKFQTVVPLEKGDDKELALWLVRESFDKTAAGEGLVIVDFTHADYDPNNIAPKVTKQLGRPITDFDWILYQGTGQRAVAV